MYYPRLGNMRVRNERMPGGRFRYKRFQCCVRDSETPLQFGVGRAGTFVEQASHDLVMQSADHFPAPITSRSLP